MDRLKTFLKYIIWIALFYIFVTVAVNIYVKTTYNTMEQEINISGPSIVLEEAQSTFVNGYIKGKIINTTKDTIIDQYIRLDFKSKHDNTIITKYIKIENLESLKTQDLEMRFNAEEIKKVTVSMTDDISNVENKQFEMDTSLGPAKLLATIILFSFI